MEIWRIIPANVFNIIITHHISKVFTPLEIYQCLAWTHDQWQLMKSREEELTIMRMRAFRRKMADHMYGFQRSSAGSLQRSCFRPLLLTEYVTVFSGRTDAPEVS